MRAGTFVRQLAESAEIDLVIVPIAGSSLDPVTEAPVRQMVTVPCVETVDTRRHTIAQMVDPRLRARLVAAQPLPQMARPAPPTLADQVIPLLGRPPEIVLGLRLGLAPLAAEVAHRTGALRLVIDSDDDDEALWRDLGDEEEAAACRRLAGTWLPEADTVLTAAPADRDRLAAAHELADVRVVPNQVEVPETVPLPPDAARILFLGNLTYAPNITAARILAEQVLPLVRASVPLARVQLVGRHDERLSHLQDVAGVELAGAVANVEEAYAGTDIVVLALAVGSGTRIKALEAFAHRRPVVATATAVAGLDVVAGQHYLGGETSHELARAASRLLTEPSARHRLVEAAAAVVEGNYTPAVVGPALRDAVLGR